MKFTKSAFAVIALVAGTIATANPALATYRHHHRHVVAPYGYGPGPAYGYGPGPAYGYPIAPYGTNAGPYYSNRYGTYPSWTYDPDPNLSAQLRSEFNRGVEIPGNGR
jgi:hypothetical protein